MAITLISFVQNTTIASASVNANFNAIVNALNGSTPNGFTFLATSNASNPLLLQLPSTPSSDQPVGGAAIPGDSTPRIAFYIRSADGQGGITGGAGAGLTNQFYVYATGGGGWTASGQLAASNGNVALADDGSTYSILNGAHNLSFRIASTHAFRASNINPWTISSTNYGFITATNSVFNQGTSNADIAEYLLTEGEILPGMVVCISANDTVSACTHECCRVAKVVSTSPTIGMTARVDSETLEPLPGHESARPIVAAGIVPVLVEGPVALRDRLTPSGFQRPGYLRRARDDEFALADVTQITEGIVYAWVHN